MKKRLLTWLLCFCMLLLLMPPAARAAGLLTASPPSGTKTVSEKEYTIAPGIKEYEWILNNDEFTEQMVGHVMEVSLGDKATIVAGYSDYNIDAIKSGNAWQMMKPTEQAQNIESRTNKNVVGAINAAGFNMSNGCPTGALVMNGAFVKAATGTTFWIDTDNKAHITEKAEFDAAVANGTVREAVSAFSNGSLVRNGACISGLDSSTRASRSAVGIKADGSVILYMVNGRQAPYSVGMTLAELAQAMKALGCVNAVNLDGGGSSMFATQREGEPNNNTTAGLTMRCRPSDGVERTVSSSLMVISNAQKDGKFDHASIEPNQEVYTPGSTVQFTVSGVDGGGYPVALPSGLTWEVTDGSGSIDSNGLYTAASDATGTVTVALKKGDTVVGSASIELQWPDQLGFTNANVSLDFGQESDLTFNPTYQGRSVHYKDGDFAWTLDETQPITYKHTVQVESYYHPVWPTGWKDVYLSLTGSGSATGQFDNGSYALYTTTYEESVSSNVSDDGTVQITAKLKHVSSTILNTDGTVYQDNITADVTPSETAKTPGTNGIGNRTVTFNVGRFSGNRFIADADNSLRATVAVSLANDPSVTGSVDVIVGMEPLVLMDFEARGDKTAQEYWSVYYQNRANGGFDGSGHVSAEIAAQNSLYIRTATSKAIDFDGSQLISETEDARVRFGANAFKLCFDFSDVRNTEVASTDFGFSSDLYVNTVQPTKIGMWVYVPKELSDCPYLLKAIMAGGVTSETGNTSLAGYNKLNADGTFTFVPGTSEPRGTTMYTQYYGTAADGSKLETLGDLAGRGWTWVEADISSMQMPIDVYRAYTVRVVKTATMSYKAVGHILVDNVQFIYGTNTNDVTNPHIESITEKTSNTMLEQNGTTLNNGSVSFEVLFDDSEQTDKYATGIDTGTIRITVDGTDYTEKAEFFPASLTLAGVTLLNGTHTVSVTMKDYYGNQSTLSRTFTVNDAAGANAALAVVAENNPPVLGQAFALHVVNLGEAPIQSATVKIDVPETYQNKYSVTYESGYSGTAQYQDGGILLTITQDSEAGTTADQLATITFQIPEDAREGDSFTYSVSTGSYQTADGTATFSEEEQKLPIEALYHVEVTAPIVNIETTLHVTDQNGASVSDAAVHMGSTELGTTDTNGDLAYTFSSGGRVSIYAATDNGRSWNESIVVCALGSNYYDAPFGIQNNGTQDPQHNQSITWLCNINTSAQTPVVRYSTEESLSEYETAEGTSKILTFTESDSGTALRANTVRLTGLTPGTTYYYQVGSEDRWSETRTFTTTEEAASSTRFFVLGDIQTDNTANLAAVVTQQLSKEQYDFGIQTGDAIDGVNKLDQWRGFLTTLNSKTLRGTDLIHTMGNHEYYGDADGLISGAIYDLPESGQNSWYKMEYGNVCVVVINNGNDLAGTVEDIADQLETTCGWKILVAHTPVYGTNEPLSGETLSQVTAAIEAAGFDFVFGGDDHSYARTYPMLNGTAQAANSTEGVVYYVSGDLSSKSNSFTKQDVHAFAQGHEDYTGAYLTAEATAGKLTVTAYDYNGNVLDSYTKTRSNCAQGKHTFDSSSVYDPETGTLTCTVCGEAVPAGDYSGLVSTDGKKTILANGQPKRSQFSQIGEVMYHSCADGTAVEAVGKNSATCTASGYWTYTCPTCHASEQIGSLIMPAGHTWNENHVCTVCGFHGINIADPSVIVNFGTVENPRTASGTPRYEYLSGGVRPASFVSVDGGKTALTASNDNTLINGKMHDLYVSWLNSTSVGECIIRYEGRGDYYGTRELQYTIIPARVRNLTASSIGIDTITLKWDAAPGAGYYQVYECDAGNTSRKLAATTESTSCTLTGLDEGSKHFYVVASRTKVGETVYNAAYWSNTLTVTTALSPSDVCGVTAEVDGVEIPMLTVENVNYLLLPASADLTALSLKFDLLPGVTGDVVVTGGKESVTADGALDVTALAEQGSDGSYDLQVSVGGGTAMLFHVMKATNVPTIYFTSDKDSERRAWVDQSKDNETTARMQMTAPDGRTIYSGALTQLKARGNSTFTYYDKKAYQIKLESKTDLLGTGEAVKTWVLLANYGDATQMHDKLFKDLAADLDMDYTASCNWVNLYYDGEYRGLYLLSEKNSVNSTSVDITDMEDAYAGQNEGYGTDMEILETTNAYSQKIQYASGLTEPKNITGGYLIELNLDQIDEASGFYTEKGVAFNVKHPEWVGEDAMRYISEYFQEFERAVYAVDANGEHTGYNSETGKYYYEYVDLDSLVKVFLIQELALNPDGFRSSLYFYKDADGIMYAGPVWDMDMTLGTGWEKYIDSSVVDYHYLAEALIKIPGFQDAVKAYAESTFLPSAEKLLGIDGKIEEYRDTISSSATMDHILWPYARVGNPSVADHLWADGTTYTTVVDDMARWIEARIQVLKTTFGLSDAGGSTSGGSGGSGGGGGGGGGGVTTYAITIATPNMDNGTVKPDRTSASKGTTVTLTVTPDESYALDTLTVTDANGNKLALTKKSAAQYTFTMPASKVTISASFKERAAAHDCPSEKLTDVDTSQYYHEAIDWAVTNGVTQGTSTTTFEPNASCTRTQMVTFLWRAAGSPAPTSTVNPFEDVKSGEYYYDAVLWAVENGITLGTSDTTFTPDATVTRGQTVAFLYRYAGSPAASGGSFTDVAADAYYAPAVQWAVANGITKGTSSTTFSPDDPCTRGQIVTFLWRDIA